MVLQRLGGLSDREAVERYASTRGGATRPGSAATAAGLGAASRTRCWWTCALGCAARPARTGSSRWVWRRRTRPGWSGRRRVLDSTPLYDAVATMDTITLIRSAVRGLLRRRATPSWPRELRAALSSGDDYVGNGKPQIDWDDRAAREELIDSRARDGYAVLALLDGRELAEPVAQAASLLATVLGQDLQTGSGRGVPDRAPGGEGSGDLHRGPRCPARAQDLRARVRRLQGPCRGGPGLGDHHRDHGHPGQRRRRQRRRRPRRRPAR